MRKAPEIGLVLPALERVIEAFEEFTRRVQAQHPGLLRVPRDGQGLRKSSKVWAALRHSTWSNSWSTYLDWNLDNTINGIAENNPNYAAAAEAFDTDVSENPGLLQPLSTWITEVAIPFMENPGDWPIVP
jgi:hypothetical protein